jgi:hypothetical protein
LKLKFLLFSSKFASFVILVLWIKTPTKEFIFYPYS